MRYIRGSVCQKEINKISNSAIVSVVIFTAKNCVFSSRKIMKKELLTFTLPLTARVALF